MLRWLVIFVFLLRTASAQLSPSCTLYTGPQKCWNPTVSGAGQCGSELITLNGQAVCSNGPGQGTYCDCAGSDNYQCVEFVKAYYKNVLHIDTSSWKIAAAYQYFASAANLGLISFKNGGTTPPEPDDILVFSDNKGDGHIAIIKSVSSTEVVIVEQNWSANGTKALTISTSGTTQTTYTIANRGNCNIPTSETCYTPLGWLRLPSTITGPSAHFTMSSQGKTASDGGTLTLTMQSGGPAPQVTLTSTSIQGSAAITNYVWKNNGIQICTGAGATCTASFSTTSNTIALAVTDANGNVSSPPAQALLTVNQVTPLTITTSSLNPATTTANQPYAAQPIAASGGTAPFSWTVSNAPTGVGINPSTGILAGTPTATGSFNLTVGVSDSGSPPQNTSKLFPLTINPGTSSLTITTASLSPSTATEGTTYTSQAMAATGGTAPYSWSVSGAPNGISMNSTTGVLSGTPTSSGPFNITVSLHDSGNPQQTTSKTFSLTVNSASSSLSITTAALTPSTATEGSSYFSQAITATGGTSPYTWSVSGAPSGITINPFLGVLSGTPASSGTYTLDVSVRDSSSPQQTASKNYMLTVNPQQVAGPTAHFTMSAPGYSTVSDPGTLTVSVPGGGSINVTFTSTSTPGSASITSYSWYRNGTDFCAGTSCAAPFGTPSNNITLTVTDANGKSASASALLIVNIGSSQPPSATTGSASAITSSSATLGATVNANGTDTHVYFLYGTNSSLSGAAQTSSQDIGAGTSGVPVSANISGLSAGTTYYFKVMASNSNGTVSGSTANFSTTTPAPYITSVTPSIPGSTTTLEPFTINGTNLPTAASGGYLEFTDTIGNTYPSTAHPTRIQSSSSTQWVYTIDDNNDAGTWYVQIFTAAGVTSNKVPFTVQ